MEKSTLHTSSDSLSTEDLTTREHQDTTSSGDLPNEPSGDPSPQETDEWDGPLFAGADELRERWESVQNSFVDEPRRAVEQADILVAETMEKLANTFSAARRRLESQWSGGKEFSTEDLRQALRQYRSFFNRLLEQSSSPVNGQRRADDTQPAHASGAAGNAGQEPQAPATNAPASEHAGGASAS
jgi:phytoene dehydrogenase-like protein